MKKPTVASPAKTPKEVLALKVAPAPAPALANQTDAQLAAGAKAWDDARQALVDAGEAAAKAQAALEALAETATDEQRNDALNALGNAERQVKAAEATIRKLTVPEGAAGTDQPVGMPPAAPGSAQPEPALAGGAVRPPATNSTHTLQSEDEGGTGNGAGPTGNGPRYYSGFLPLQGDHAALPTGVLVVTTKRQSRWRAGRQFTKGGKTRIPMIELTETEFRAITEDPVLECRLEPAAG